MYNNEPFKNAILKYIARAENLIYFIVELPLTSSDTGTVPNFLTSNDGEDYIKFLTDEMWREESKRSEASNLIIREVRSLEGQYKQKNVF